MDDAQPAGLVHAPVDAQPSIRALASMRAQPSVRAQRYRLPHLQPALDRWDALVLDPERLDAASRPAAMTVYRGGALLVHPADPAALNRTRAAIDALLVGRGWIADQHGAAVQLTRSSTSAAPLDPWTVISELRAGTDPAIAAAVGLDHLLTAAEQVGGNPFALGHGETGLDHYGAAGYAGRGPVTLVLPLPRARSTGRRPRVVILDTGVGRHPWFAQVPAQTSVALADGTVVGPAVDPATIRGIDADPAGAIANALLGSLGSHTGHGTFLAGLVRQACPDADIVALAVMGADGMVPESTLTDALRLVDTKQREQPGWADALVLSLGYYAETAEDVRYTTALHRVLMDLAEHGVAVFCAAGNDATSRPSYPAAFATDPAFARPDVMPLVSVAALDPDGSVAGFSNDGPWVTAQAPGVNLISSVPTDADGSARAAVRAPGRPGGRPREAIDPDEFSGGFASWSGTSFAAPVLAGRYLLALAAAGFPAIPERRLLVPTGRTLR